MKQYNYRYDHFEGMNYLEQNATHTITMRDKFIIAQALVLGIQALEEVPAPYTEVSNIMDMKELLHGPFSEFAHVARMMVLETNKIYSEMGETE